MDNVKKQKKLLRTFIDCLVVAYANELAENHISEELQKMRSKVLEYFPEYSFYYNTLTREHSKEIAAMRDKII
ncbi:MAG: hypothetical protein LBP53_03035 [Candidatus Peribacteria bacterium]|jgi:hypothetical protein|nr:hypothetical protein [Candidatus Peribacteria bacterium]